MSKEEAVDDAKMGTQNNVGAVCSTGVKNTFFATRDLRQIEVIYREVEKMPHLTYFSFFLNLIKYWAPFKLEKVVESCSDSGL